MFRGYNRITWGINVVRFASRLSCTMPYSSSWGVFRGLFAFVILIAIFFFVTDVSHGEEDQSGGSWKPIWSFTIPRLLEENRHFA
jgi:hypothetical protein